MNDYSPIGKCAAVHTTNKFIYIETISGYTRKLPDGRGYKSYLTPGASIKTLGLEIMKALDMSRVVDPDTDRQFFNGDQIYKAYLKWKQDMINHYGLKSKIQVFKGMTYCEIEMKHNKIILTPLRYDKPLYWDELPKDQNVVIPATSDAEQMGAALRLALSRCG